MAENKTKQTEVSVGEFIENVENERRRNDAYTLLKLMEEETGEPPKMWGPSIIGFGKYRYRYESGREGEWFLCGFSPRKAKQVLYIMAGFEGHDALLGRLGKHKVGKSCLYVNKLGDVDTDVLRELVNLSAAHVKSTSI